MASWLHCFMASCCVTVDYLAAAIFGQLLVNYFKLQLFQKFGFYLFILYNRVNLNIPHTIFFTSCANTNLTNVSTSYLLSTEPFNSVVVLVLLPSAVINPRF